MGKSQDLSRRPSRRLRCAIYTRKSSDEGLEQAFNSLDAQREACAAFVLSQKHEGWSVLPTLYDDGGYSGGTLDRPDLQRLLADIAEAKGGGHKLSRGALYLMLQNRIYRGEITHKGSAYPGEHKAIVDEALWDKVQAVLSENRVDRATGSAAKYPSLLAGLAFDDSGERLTPTHAVKKGTRYRYYVSKSLITEAAKDHSQGRRIPAGNLEGLVIGLLRAFLADEGAVLGAITNAEQNGVQQRKLISRGRQISEELPTLAPDAVRSILMTLVNRVDIKAEHIEIRVYRQRLHDLLQARSTGSLAPQADRNKPDDILRLKVKARLQRVGREMKLVVHNAEDRTAADPGLLRIIARAHDFQERLIQDPDLTVPAIASQDRLTIGYLSRLLRLPSLAPDIVASIINGKHPPELSAKRVMRLALKLPTDWNEQRKLLRFQRQ